MAEAEDWNSKIIAEFRANGGKVGGPFEGAPLLLLHTVGAKSGQPRVTPVMYRDLGDEGVAVFASKAGAPTNPDWYHNLLANPQVSAEIGTGTVEAVARVAEGEERDRIWEAHKQRQPGLRGLRAQDDPADSRGHPGASGRAGGPGRAPAAAPAAARNASSLFESPITGELWAPWRRHRPARAPGPTCLTCSTSGSPRPSTGS